MSDLLAALEPVVSAFESLGVTYRIGGSVASSALGVARTTLDIDVVSNLQLTQAHDFTQALTGSFYVDQKMIEDAIRHTSSFNVIHLESMVKVDVFVLKSRAYDQAAFVRSCDQQLAPGSATFHLSTPEDVVLNKLEWFRMGGEVSERQWKDVLGVLRVQRDLDTAWMVRWAPDLGVLDLLEKALAEAK